jgi:hypothetical protein
LRQFLARQMMPGQSEPAVPAADDEQEGQMTDAAIRQESFRLDDGDVIISFPAKISPRGVEDLKFRLDLLIDELRGRTDAERQAFLRGLAELAAYEASR